MILEEHVSLFTHIPFGSKNVFAILKAIKSVWHEKKKIIGPLICQVINPLKRWPDSVPAVFCSISIDSILFCLTVAVYLFPQLRPIVLDTLWTLTSQVPKKIKIKKIKQALLLGEYQKLNLVHLI